MIFAVAPFAGAWIEIDSMTRRALRLRSLPSRERGLKFKYDGTPDGQEESLPSRERGLKLELDPLAGSSAQRVAPFAGAWIEI